MILKDCRIGDAAIELDIFHMLITSHSGLAEYGFSSPIPAELEKFNRLYLFVVFLSIEKIVVSAKRQVGWMDSYL